MRTLILVLVTSSFAITACDESLLDPDLLVYSRLGQGQFDTISNDLGLHISYPETVRRWETVPIRLTLTNLADTTVTVMHNRSMPYDLVVTRPDSVVVWELNFGLNMPDVGWMRTLEPNGSLVFDAHWDQTDYNGKRVERGSYLIRGVFWGNLFYYPDGGIEEGEIWTPALELRIE